MAVGLPVALGSLRVVGSFLYGVSPWNTATLAAVLALLSVVGFSAGVVPAWTAARPGH